jgi:hypothetical protein
VAKKVTRIEGIAFLTRVTQLVCSEYEFTYKWTHDADTYILQVDCRDRTVRFQFPITVLDDPGCDEYRELTERMLERLLEEFRAKGNPLD